ncbi:MAG: ABC transporter substrate-binding protein [Spirochaetes bacterium]|nr:ABC transporter substrate-binding protein [Spirochaetota bacterium]
MANFIHNISLIRRGLPGLILAVAFVLCFLLCSRPEKVYRVGIISGFDSFLEITDGFKTKLTGLGYVEGRNIIYDVQKVEADPAGMENAAKKFVADNVDLILAFPTEAAVIAKNAAAGTGIPVVFANANIEGTGLVESVRHPGGNVTGVHTMLAEQTVKRIEILHELAPGVKKIYIPHDANYPGVAEIMDLLRRTARSLNVTLVEIHVVALKELQADLYKRESSGNTDIDAIMIMPRLPVSAEGFSVLNNFALKHNLPLAGTLPFMTDQGALFNFALNHFSVGAMAAYLAEKIFSGTPAGTLPVVTAELDLRINYKRARKLKLTVSEGMLRMAKEVLR